VDAQRIVTAELFFSTLAWGRTVLLIGRVQQAILVSVAAQFDGDTSSVCCTLECIVWTRAVYFVGSVVTISVSVTAKSDAEASAEVASELCLRALTVESMRRAFGSIFV
jgi:hypothetical protein